MMTAKLRITQTKSGISETPKHRNTLRSLGLKRIGNVVEHDDTPAVRGYIRKVAHLVTVEEIDD